MSPHITCTETTHIARSQSAMQNQYILAASAQLICLARLPLSYTLYICPCPCSNMYTYPANCPTGSCLSVPSLSKSRLCQRRLLSPQIQNDQGDYSYSLVAPNMPCVVRLPCRMQAPRGPVVGRNLASFCRASHLDGKDDNTSSRPPPFLPHAPHLKIKSKKKKQLPTPSWYLEKRQDPKSSVFVMCIRARAAGFHIRGHDPRIVLKTAKGKPSNAKG
ncbi:hypothetical protein J3F83DRAFT_564461 [Trichoderma novae-zelandiae]